MPKWKEIYEHIAKLPIELKHRIESVYRPESNIPSKLANHLLDFDGGHIVSCGSESSNVR